MKWTVQIQTLIAIVLVVVLSVASRPRVLLAAAPVKVFLLGGQSNMVGQGSQGDLTGPLAFLKNPQADVLFYSQGSGTPAPSTPGIGGTLTSLQPGSFLTDGFGTQFGPELTFGRTIADALPSENFALIKYARGGSSLSGNWNPNTGPDYIAGFQKTVTDGLAAMASAGHATEIVGMLWVQGERDVVIGTHNAYEANLTAFIADVRNEYGADLPFLIGQLSTNQTSLNASRLAIVRQAQENVSNMVSNTSLIDTESFSIKGDNLHFDSAGQIAYGQAFAAAALPFLIPEPTSAALLFGGAFGLLGVFRRRR